MRNLIRLTRVFLFGSGYGGLGSDARRRKRRFSGAGNIALFAFLGIYFSAATGASAWGLYGLLSQAGLAAAMLGLFVSAGVTVVFFFGFMYIISVFYFSSDIEKILPLPLYPEQVIGAKFLVTMIYEYLFLGVIVLPPLLVYGIRSGAGAAFFLTLAAVFLLLPVIPLSLAAIIIMVLMRFTRFARNRDRLNMVSMLLAMALALGFTFGMQSLTSRNGADLGQTITLSTERVVTIASSVFPGTSFASLALAGAGTLRGLGSLALLALSAMVASLLMLGAGRLLYFQGVIGLSGANANRRRLTRAELDEAGRSGSPVLAMAMKDIRILLRTPIYFVNCVLMNFLWPIFLLMPFFTGGQAINREIIVAFLHQFLFEGQRPGLAVSLAAVVAVTVFIASTNGIAASALSREGRQLYIMKILPLGYGWQVAAKIAVGILFGAIGWFMMVLVAVFFLAVPFWYLLLMLLVMPGALLLPNLLGIIFDLMWPKLQWESEQTAVKRNMNTLYNMLGSVFFAILAAGPVVALRLPFLPSLLILVLVPLAIDAVLFLILRRSSARLISSIEA